LDWKNHVTKSSNLSDVKKGRYPDFYSKKVLLALFSFPGLQVTNTGLLASSSGPGEERGILQVS
jgi:hypothetical protein